MKKLILPLAFAAALITACDEDIDSRHRRNDGNENVVSAGDFSGAGGGFQLSIKDKVAFGNLVAYPVIADEDFLNAYKNLGNYMTLKEGIASGKVVVSEHGNGNDNLARHQEHVQQQRESYNRESNSSLVNGTIVNSSPSTSFASAEAENGRHDSPTVNSLSIENQGDDTVLVLAGELVRGGNQDRVVAEDIVLNPHSGKVNLPVFCVEANRWTHEGFYDNTNVFGFTNNFASTSIREIVTQKKDQSAVWNRVSEVTTVNAASSSTNSYNALESSEQFTAERKEYLAHFKNAFKNLKGVIGIVVADKNNHVMGCDIFCKPELFAAEYEGLLHAYIAEAITAEEKKVDVSNILPEKYFTRIQSDYRDEDYEEGTYKLFHKGAVVHYSRF